MTVQDFKAQDLSLHNPQFVSALLDATKRHSAASFRSGDALTGEAPRIWHSAILGYDYHENTLLTDELQSADENFLVRAKTAPVWLQTRYSDGYVNALCLLMSNTNGLLSWQILDGEITANRRWNKRIYFHQNVAPTVKVELPYYPTFSGVLKDLSAFGARIKLYTDKEQSEPLSRTPCICTFIFDEEFTIHIKGELRQSRMKRSPHCYMDARIVFLSDYANDKNTTPANSPQALAIAKLNAYIDAMSSLSNR